MPTLVALTLPDSGSAYDILAPSGDRPPIFADSGGAQSLQAPLPSGQTVWLPAGHYRAREVLLDQAVDLVAGVPVTLPAKASFNPLPTNSLLPTSLIGWRRGLNNMLNGTRPARILCIGDSTTRGFGDTVDAKGFPADLASVLVGRGFQSVRGLVIPEFQRGVQAVDPRIAKGTGWTSGNLAGFSWAGTSPYWTAPAAAAGSLVFTPGTLCDRFDVYFLSLGGLSSSLATATGGTGQTLAGNQSTAIRKVTCLAASASNANTLTIGTVGAGSGTFIVGIEAYNGATPLIVIGNCGVNGANTAGWVNAANAPAGPLDSIAAYGPDLSIILLGVNDANLGVTPAAYAANLQTLITACKANGGSVMLMSPLPESSANAGFLTLNQYLAQLQTLAQTNGCPLIDMLTRWGGAASGFSTLNPLGWYFDTVHPDPVGYQDVATTLASALAAV